MESIGYKSLDIKSLEELSKLDKPRYAIEVLCGEKATGKTYLMDKYYEENENIIYMKSNIGDTDKIDIDIDELKEEELLDKLKEINKNKILIYEHYNHIKFLKMIDIIIEFAKEKNYTLLLDIDYRDTLYLLRNYTDITVICSQYRKPFIDNNSYKMPVIFTFVDYKIKNKLNETYSGNVSLRLPKSLHGQLSKEAFDEGISLNQYLLYILASRN